MIVLDASAMVDTLLRAPGSDDVASRIEAETLVAPHLLDYEVLSVIRRLVLRGELSVGRAHAALEDFALFQIQREVAAGPLLGRMLQLRDAVSGYDAAYVALAEALECSLITRDVRLARSSGHDATVECP